MEKLIIEFMYNNKKRNVCINDKKIIFDDKMLYIQGLELDNKSGLRLFKKYIKKNITDIKLILPEYLIEKFNNKFNLGCNEDDDYDEKYSNKETIDTTSGSKTKFSNRENIILFKYKKSNPEKIRKFKVEKEDNQKYYGYEIDGSNKIYKTFNKDFEWFAFHTIEAKLLPVSQKVNTAEDINVKRYCTNCGAKLAKGDKFCATCGTKA
jgi:hypothetical protein